MYEVYFNYEPIIIVIVDWKDVKISNNEKSFYTLIYSKYWDWEWNQDYYSVPLYYSGDKQENVLGLLYMKDAIKKLFERSW